MSGGIVFERATWAPPIGAIVSGSLLAFLNGKLAPTPVAEDGNRSGDTYGNGSLHLKGWARGLIPTPIAGDGLGGGFTDPDAAKERSPRRGQKLQDVVALLPTSTAMDSNGSRNRTAGRKPGSQHHDGETLTDWARTADLIPTPMASRSGCNGKLLDRLVGTPMATDSNSGPNPPENDKSRLKAQVRGPLSPSLHLWLMAWPEGASSCEPLERESFLSWLRAHGIG